MTKHRKDLNKMFDQWMSDQVSLKQMFDQLEAYINQVVEKAKWTGYKVGLFEGYLDAEESKKDRLTKAK